MAYMTQMTDNSNMAEREESFTSASSSDLFQPYPAIHEDDFKLRHRIRYSYDFHKMRKKKRKVKLRVVGDRERDLEVNTSISSENEPLQPRLVPDDVLGYVDDFIEEAEQIVAITVEDVTVTDLDSYITELVRMDAITVVDFCFQKFAIPDMDLEKKALHETKYAILCREGSRGNLWIYTCSCSSSRRRSAFLGALSSSVDIESLTTANAAYEQCIHIKALERTLLEFDSENCVSPQSYADHSYQRAHCDITPISGKEFTVFIAASACNITSDGVVGLQGSVLTCFTCGHQVHHCEHVKYLKHKEENECFDLPDCLVDLFAEQNSRHGTSALTRLERVPKAISYLPIPFHLTPAMKTIFPLMEQKFDSLKSDSGVIQLYPELPSSDSICCKCSSGWAVEDPLPSGLQVLCFSKKRIFHCEVFHYPCRNSSCDEKLDFDGSSLTVLNMGSYLVSYEVLRDFMFHFVQGRCTMFTYYNVWREIMRDSKILDFEKLLSYHHWRFAWYNFLDLLDVNVNCSGFCCTVCGSTGLDLVVCDGTTLAFRQDFCSSLKFSQNINSSSLPAGSQARGSRHHDRVYLTEKRLRQLVEIVGRDISSIDEQILGSLLLDLQRSVPAFGSFISWCISVYGSDVPFPAALSAFLIALSKASPVCALLPQWDSLEALYTKLVNKVPVKQSPEDMLLLQRNCPLVFDLLQCIEGDSPPDALSNLLCDLLVKAKAPFAGDPVPVVSIQPEDVIPGNDVEYFPSLPVIRHRGVFALDTESSSKICTKKSGRHPSLLPGIFLVHCRHGITLGFSVMLSNESPNIPFTVLKTRFPKAPRLIVYDNACNLHSYALNRDPHFFKDSQFLVDRLHWLDHTGCSEGYNLSRYPEWDNLNSQAAEQANSALKYLKGSLSYMNQHNFMKHLKFFLWHRNSELLKKL